MMIVHERGEVLLFHADADEFTFDEASGLAETWQSRVSASDVDSLDGRTDGLIELIEARYGLTTILAVHRPRRAATSRAKPRRP